MLMTALPLISLTFLAISSYCSSRSVLPSDCCIECIGAALR